MATTFKKAAPKPLPVQLTAKTKESPEGASEHVKATSLKAAPKATKAPKEYGVSGEDISDPTPDVIEGTQAVATVNKKFKDGTETDEQIPVGGIKKFNGPHATVGLSMAVTRNLGNYESVKTMVSLYMPCENTEQAIQETFDEVKGWVDTRVELLNQEVNEQLA